MPTLNTWMDLQIWDAPWHLLCLIDVSLQAISDQGRISTTARADLARNLGFIALRHQPPASTGMADARNRLKQYWLQASHRFGRADGWSRDHTARGRSATGWETPPTDVNPTRSRLQAETILGVKIRPAGFVDSWEGLAVKDHHDRLQ